MRRLDARCWIPDTGFLILDADAADCYPAIYSTFNSTKMELVLFRTCHPTGTNGELYARNSFQCYTIELPWKDNQPQVSCIPPGRYELKKRYSPRFKDHLLVGLVPGRSLVLLHPANDALKELRGCIAPVSSGPPLNPLPKRGL